MPNENIETPETPTPTAPETPTNPPDPSLVSQQPPETPPAPATSEFVPLTVEDIKFPEGMQVADGDRDSFLGILNNRELTPAQQAQALVDLQAKVSKEASEAGSQAWSNLQTEWVNEVKADPEVGGAKLEGVLGSIGKLVDQYGSPELRATLDLTGAGNSVHMIKFLNKVASALTEGGHVSGSPGNQELSVADLIYNKKGS